MVISFIFVERDARRKIVQSTKFLSMIVQNIIQQFGIVYEILLSVITEQIIS